MKKVFCDICGEQMSVDTGIPYPGLKDESEVAVRITKAEDICLGCWKAAGELDVAAVLKKSHSPP